MLVDITAERIQAVAALVFAIAVLVIGIVVASRSRRLVAEVRGMKLTMDTKLAPQLEDVQAKAVVNTVAIEQINSAVNHKLPHEPTMVRRLADVEASVKRLDGKFDRFVTATGDWQDALVSKIGVDVRTANDEQTSTEAEAR
jgi:uncharacterized protein YoxC